MSLLVKQLIQLGFMKPKNRKDAEKDAREKVKKQLTEHNELTDGNIVPLVLNW